MPGLVSSCLGQGSWRASTHLDTRNGALGLAANGEEDLKPQDQADQDNEVSVAPWPLGRGDLCPRRIGPQFI